MHKSYENLITVIIPVFNEYEGIPFLVESLNTFFGLNSHLKAEVIFVNDGSMDQSAKRLSEIDHRTYKAKIINLSRNFGSHAALRAGIANASGDFICFNYADLQDPLELIIEMKERMEDGKDIIWAHRESTTLSWSEKAFSGGYAFLMKKFAFKNFPDKGYDNVMFDRKVAGENARNVDANCYIFLQIIGLGFRETSISYEKRERKTGSSKWTFSKKVKQLIDSFVAFSIAPIKHV